MTLDSIKAELIDLEAEAFALQKGTPQLRRLRHEEIMTLVRLDEIQCRQEHLLSLSADLFFEAPSENL